MASFAPMPIKQAMISRSTIIGAIKYILPAQLKIIAFLYFKAKLNHSFLQFIGVLSSMEFETIRSPVYRRR